MTLRALAVGLGAALGLALPAVLVVQLVDALGDGEGTPALAYPAAVIVFAAMGVGGWAAGRRTPRRPAATGAVVGLIAIALLLALGAVRQAVADEVVEWGPLPGLALVATAAGALGGHLGARRPGRTRP